MDIYLPIAGLSVNIVVIILLGGAVGMLSGMFGVGGGLLTTPLLIFYGIPPTVAAASASTQVTGASVSGVFAHMRRGGVDFHMGAVLVVGGLLGTLFGAVLVSGFWSIINERFDARTARKYIGRIGVGATVGGIVGGLIVERASALAAA